MFNCQVNKGKLFEEQVFIQIHIYLFFIYIVNLYIGYFFYGGITKGRQNRNNNTIDAIRIQITFRIINTLDY